MINRFVEIAYKLKSNREPVNGKKVFLHSFTLCAKISREERFIHIHYGIVTQMRKIGRSGEANPKEQKT
jgi:hypothetical protein